MILGFYTPHAHKIPHIDIRREARETVQFVDKYRNTDYNKSVETQTVATLVRLYYWRAMLSKPVSHLLAADGSLFLLLSIVVVGADCKHQPHNTANASNN